MDKRIKFSKCKCEVTRGKFDINNLPLDCPATWQLISSGHTVGVFQLEKQLGQDWAAKVKPSNLLELAALGAILRPGALNSGMSQQYVDTKFNKTQAKYLHPALKPILDKTYSALVYQEQAINIAVNIAGFGLEEADNLRKAMGKKDVELMDELKIKFTEGCKKKGIVPKDAAEEIFGWIEKGQRYSFNKCVSKNTRFKRVNIGHHEFHPTIGEMYQIRNDINYAKKTGHLALYKKWKFYNSYRTALSMFKDNRVRKNVIKDIKYAGEQNLYRITLENGSFIDATINHKFPTENGIKKLEHLNTSDYLYICGNYSKNTNNYSFTGEKQDGKNKKYGPRQGFPKGSSNPGYINGTYTEYQKNKAKLPKQCEICNVENVRIEIHHKDGDRNNNKINNLMPLCCSCHKKIEYKNGRTKQFEKGYPTKLFKIVSIDPMGQEDVYDVIMDGPNHNFVVDNGIITCNSHAIGYAELSFQTSWLKAHFPHEFFTSYLTFSHHKGDPKEEIYKLVQDAKLFGVKILGPDIRRGNIDFKLLDNKDISFGLRHIKGVGESAVEKIVDQKKRPLYTWLQFLAAVPSLHRNVGLALIKSGACDCYGMSRNDMAQQLELILGTTGINDEGKKREIKGLTPKEREWFFAKLNNEDEFIKILTFMSEDPDSLPPRLKDMKKAELSALLDQKYSGGIDDTKLKKAEIVDLLIERGYKEPERSPCTSSRREIIRQKLKDLGTGTKDTNTSKATAEKYFLGIALSCSAADDVDDHLATHTCLDIAKSANKEGIVVCAVIESVKHTKTKRGKNPGSPMCFINISDSTYAIDHAVVFPDAYKRLKSLCRDNIICLIHAQKKNGSLIIYDISKLM